MIILITINFMVDNMDKQLFEAFLLSSSSIVMSLITSGYRLIQSYTQKEENKHGAIEMLANIHSIALSSSERKKISLSYEYLFIIIL